MNIIYKILNWSPFFHISTDEQFGSIGGGSKRYSLIEVSTGPRKIYLFSFLESGGSYKFFLMHVLKFDSLCRIMDQSEIKSRVAKYETLIRNENCDSINNHIDFLKEKISMCQSRTESAYNKINLYTAIILAHIGFIVYLVDQLVKSKQESHIFSYSIHLLFSMSIYYAINYALLINSAISIKGYIRAAFKDIKIDCNIKKLAAAYYLDWSSTDNQSQVLTSIVTNIEKYFIRGFAMSLVVWMLLFLGNNVSVKPAEVLHEGDEFLIYNKSGEFQKSEFIKLLSHIDVGTKKIYIISNAKDDNALLLGKFIKSTLAEPRRVIEIDFKNELINARSVIIQHKD